MNQAQILGLIRHLLTFAGGWVVAKGWATDAMWAEISGAVVTLIGFGWSLFLTPEKKQLG